MSKRLRQCSCCRLLQHHYEINVFNSYSNLEIVVCARDAESAAMISNVFQFFFDSEITPPPLPPTSREPMQKGELPKATDLLKGRRLSFHSTRRNLESSLCLVQSVDHTQEYNARLKVCRIRLRALVDFKQITI